MSAGVNTAGIRASGPRQRRGRRGPRRLARGDWPGARLASVAVNRAVVASPASIQTVSAAGGTWIGWPRRARLRGAMVHRFVQDHKVAESRLTTRAFLPMAVPSAISTRLAAAPRRRRIKIRTRVARQVGSGGVVEVQAVRLNLSLGPMSPARRAQSSWAW
jgi:hypothetical protein